MPKVSVRQIVVTCILAFAIEVLFQNCGVVHLRDFPVPSKSISTKSVRAE
jgi:hypothetical protein